MFEKTTRLQVKTLLESQLADYRVLEELKLVDRLNEPKMTRKNKTRYSRIYQSGYCAVCHIPYTNLEEHIHSKRHIQLLGDDFIAIRGLDSFLDLEADDVTETRSKASKKNRTCERRKSPASPVESECRHHLRSRKNINYMTPPLDDDSLTEHPETIPEFRELRTSARLLAKLTEQIENDEVWNSGRPKRTCNRSRISSDERLVVDNKSYYKMDLLPNKLRSAVAPIHTVRRSETPIVTEDKNKIKKPRNSELLQLNTEAENFLFPKKDDTESSDDEDEGVPLNRRLVKCEANSVSDADERKFKFVDEESQNSTFSDSKVKKKRLTHAEAFILDNQKYYKFETPGSRLRYQGSYLSPVPAKSRYNGDYFHQDMQPSHSKDFSLDDYQFSFESVPRNEAWYTTFERKDLGEEKYVFLSDEPFWDPLYLPYQLDYIHPLDPRDCLLQYNHIKKCLTESVSASTSVTCSTPDPTASNSSVDNQDEDSKISATDISSTSTLDEIKPLRLNKRRVVAPISPSSSKNPRKSPRQHASTLAILSSLIHQRKRKKGTGPLPTIVEESPRKKVKVEKIDYVGLLKRVEEEFAVNDERFEVIPVEDDGVVFETTMAVEDLFGISEERNETAYSCKSMAMKSSKPGRKPGRRKKNRTGWPMTRTKKLKKEPVTKEDESTGDSLNGAVHCEEINSTDSVKKQTSVELQNSENNNQNDQHSLSERREGDRVNDKILKTKVNNNSVGRSKVNVLYQPYVRVQKLDKSQLGNNRETTTRNTSPKRTNRGQRRMPASPKSPKMLRRPRGRWYRER